MNKELLERLKELSVKDSMMDNMSDFNPMEFSGGNFDDAYFRGIDDGKIELAREILNKYEIN